MSPVDALVFIGLAVLVGQIAVTGIFVTAAVFKTLVCGCSKKK